MADINELLYAKALDRIATRQSNVHESRNAHTAWLGQPYRRHMDSRAACLSEAT